MELALQDLRLQLAAMTLDAGWRHMDAFDETVSDDRGARPLDTGDPASNLATGLGAGVSNLVTGGSPPRPRALRRGPLHRPPHRPQR